jgi:predicted nuclease with TOPRIM domain
LLATKDLEERIAPLFRRWEEVKKENDDLRDRLNVLHGESVAAKEKAKKERAAIRDEREEAQRLAQKVGTYRTILKGKDGEVAKLKTELEERDKKVWLQHFFLFLLLDGSLGRSHESQIESPCQKAKI